MIAINVSELLQDLCNLGADDLVDGSLPFIDKKICQGIKVRAEELFELDRGPLQIDLVNEAMEDCIIVWLRCRGVILHAGKNFQVAKVQGGKSEVFFLPGNLGAELNPAAHQMQAMPVTLSQMLALECVAIKFFGRVAAKEDRNRIVGRYLS